VSRRPANDLRRVGRLCFRPARSRRRRVGRTLDCHESMRRRVDGGTESPERATTWYERAYAIVPNGGIEAEGFVVGSSGALSAAAVRTGFQASTGGSPGDGWLGSGLHGLARVSQWPSVGGGRDGVERSGGRRAAEGLAAMVGWWAGGLAGAAGWRLLDLCVPGARGDLAAPDDPCSGWRALWR